MRNRSLVSLAGWMALVMAAGATGAFASRDAASFYGQLARPSWAPPSSLFGPVWTALYLVMGIAAWRVARAGSAARHALVLFLLQLAINVLWSWLFFAWHLGGAALADVLVLDALVIATLIAFGRIDKIAAALLAPYLGWIAYATALNWAVWKANPVLLR